MPMFDYRCGKCGHLFEELVISSTAPDETIQCPECGGYQSQRLLSAPAVSVGSSFGSSGTPSGCSTPPGSGFG